MHQGGASKGRPTLKDVIGPHKEVHQLHTPLQVAPLLHGAIIRGACLTLNTHFKKKLSTLSRCSICVGFSVSVSGSLSEWSYALVLGKVQWSYPWSLERWRSSCILSSCKTLSIQYNSIFFIVISCKCKCYYSFYGSSTFGCFGVVIVV
jgi:hypothetical protein